MHGRLPVNVTPVLLMLLLLPAGCRTDEQVATTLALAGTSWTLVSVEHDGKKHGIPEDARPPTAVFTPDELEHARGSVTGFAGVNRYFGQYTTTPEGGLTIGDVGSTRMAGPPELMDLEQAFLAVISGAKTCASPDSDTLVITAESGSARLARERS